MIPESITIALPLPARVLQPNCTIATMGGRFMKAKAIKRYRGLACEAVEGERIETKPWPGIVIQAIFYHKTERQRDFDNAASSLKAAFDGIVDSGLIKNDDSMHVIHEKPIFEIDKIHPRVELVITQSDVV